MNMFTVNFVIMEQQNKEKESRHNCYIILWFNGWSVQ